MPTPQTNPKHLSAKRKRCPACRKMFHPNKYNLDQKCCTTDCAKTIPRGKYKRAVKRICTMCPTEFKCPARSKRTTCSTSCSAKEQWKDPDKIPVPLRPLITLNCAWCKKDFDVQEKRTPSQLAEPYPTTCCTECKKANNRVTRKCADCGTEFEIYKSQVGKVSGRYCSKPCATTPKAYRWRAKQMKKTRRKRGLKPYGCYKHEYAGHKLDSSWELDLVRRLDELGLNWTRGYHRLPWTDSFGETFIYEPDVYLVDYDCFIEVKGDHLVRIDEAQSDKIEYIRRHYKEVVFLGSAKACRNFSVIGLKRVLDKQRQEVV